MYDPNQLMGQVNPANFFGGLPQSTPFVANIQLNNPQLSNLAPMMTAFALMELQNNAQKNPVRANLYLACAQNSWNNDTFSQLMNALAELTDLYISMYRQDPQSAVANAAAATCRFFSTYLAVQNGMINAMPNLQQAATATLGEFEQVKQQIAQMNQQRRPAAPMGYGPIPNNGGYPGMGGGYPGNGYPGNGYPGNTFPPMNNGMMGSTYPPMNGGIVGGGAVYPPQAMMAPMHSGVSMNQAMNSIMAPAGARPLVHHTPTAAPTMTARPAHTRQAADIPMKAPIEEAPYMYERNNPAPKAGAFKPLPGREKVAPQRFEAAPVSTTQVAVQESHQPAAMAAGGAILPAEAITVPVSKTEPVMASAERPYDQIILQDGSVVVPAVLHPELKPTLDSKQPYRKVYDAAKYALFYVKTPEGKIYEVLQERDKTMDYLEHELNQRLRNSIKDNENLVLGRNVAPDWSLVSKFKPHPRVAIAAQEFLEEEEVEEGDELPGIEVELIERLETVSSLSDAEFKAAIVSGEVADVDKAFESYFNIANKLTPIKDADIVGLLESLKVDDYPTLRQKLNEVRDNDAFGLGDNRQTVFTALNEIITESVNRIVQWDLGLEAWSIDDFSEDILDLLAMLRDTYGVDMAAKVESTINLVTSELRPIVNGRSKTVGYRAAILWLPWTTGDLSLDINGGGMIAADEMPEMQKAVEEMFNRTSEYDRRFLLTDDAKLFELRKGLLAADCYLIYPTNV